MSIPSSDSVSVEQITRKGYEVAVKLERVADSLNEILNQVKSGKGTIGKLVFDESLYNEVESMVKDLKAHPWKLLQRPSRPKKKTVDKSGKEDKGAF